MGRRKKLAPLILPREKDPERERRVVYLLTMSVRLLIGHIWSRRSRHVRTYPAYERGDRRWGSLFFPSTRRLPVRIESSFIRGIRAIPRLRGSNIQLAQWPGLLTDKNERIPFDDRVLDRRPSLGKTTCSQTYLLSSFFSSRSQILSGWTLRRLSLVAAAGLTASGERCIASFRAVTWYKSFAFDDRVRIRTSCPCFWWNYSTSHFALFRWNVS